MKRIMTLCLAVLLVFTLLACGSDKNQQEDPIPPKGYNIKIGVIYSGTETDAYNQELQKAVTTLQETLGLSENQIIIKKKVTKPEKAYDAAADLADQFCDIIFSTSFHHEPHVLRAALEYPDAEFCMLGGYQAQSSELDNVHNYFADVYQARYVSGIVAGMKLNEMIESGKITAEQAKMGYMGAFSYSEVVSGYTAFYLGARSVCETVTMDVKYVGAWKDRDVEEQTAQELIDGGCVLLSHHTDTDAIATVCEEAGVPFVGYHASMLETAPTQALTSVTVDWAPYFCYAAQSVLDGNEFDVDWCQGYADNVVGLTELNEACVAPKTAEAVLAAEESIKQGTLQVFDLATFAVKGEQITTTATEEFSSYYFGQEYIQNGAFLESVTTSAPSFAFQIDGITELNWMY